jgi:peptide/nickel transport system substrate-binding protein
MVKKIVSLLLVLLMTTAFAFAAGEQEGKQAAKTPEGPVRALIVPPDRVTPGSMSAGAGAIFASCVYDWLVRIDGETGEVVPSLAESYEMSDDAKTWTFKLREGVKFHHGTELTAEDVKFTAERWIDPDLGSALQGVFGDLLDSVEVVDTYTVRFHLNKSEVNLDLKLLDFNAAILAHDYNYDEKGETAPSGTGAWMVENYVPRERATFKANPDYWIDGVPYMDTLEILFIPETETQIKMMESGQADIITDISVDQYRRLDSANNVEGDYIELAHHVPLSMRCDVEPFNDPRVRKAMKLVVDREEMLESVMYGMGTLGNDHPIPPFNPNYDDLGGIREQDIEEAKRLLKEAGYPDGLTVTIYCGSNIPPVLDVVLAYQQMAKKAGITVEISTSTRDVYLSKYWLDAKFKATLWGHREDPTQLLNLAYKCGAPWNEGHYCNEELDKLVEQLSAETNEEKRQQLFSQIQQVLHDDGPSIISFFQPYFGATSTRIEDFYMTRNWINDYRFIKTK